MPRLARFVLIAVPAVLAACAVSPSDDSQSSAAEISASTCAAASAWASGVAYTAGQVVSYQGAEYVCLQSHTSQADWTPTAAPSLWEPASCGGGSTGGGGSSGGGSASTAISPGQSYSFSTAVSSGSCLDVKSDASANFTQIEEYQCNGTPAQTFKVLDAGGGLVYLQHPNSGRCIDLYAAGTADGTKVELYDCNQTVAQQFQALDAGGGMVTFMNPHSGRCLDVAGANPANFTVVQLWDCNHTVAQKWTPAAPGPSGDGTTGGGGGGGGTGLASILSESQFDGMFPNRNAFYTYQGLVAATAKFPSFASSGNATVDRQEVAAFLANVAHETASLVYIDEIVQGPYCQAESGCGCGGGEYFGRGPLQLSWNYNYCAAGAALGLDLVDNPNLVSTDATVSWETALWFWMTSTGAGSETCHQAITSGAGFGQTIRTINGGIECNGGDPSEVQDRVSFYQQFCGTLSVSPGGNLTC